MAPMLAYMRDHRYFAMAARELEPLVAAELRELGARDVEPIFRGVYFQADQETLYRVNYCARLASRILAPLTNFPCHSEDELYRSALRLPWSDLFSVNQTFAIWANVSDSHISHSRFAALKLKDAIADHFRQSRGQRPSVDTSTPDIEFHLHIRRNQATVSLDTSGGALHRRGYRLASVAAPVMETTAAAVIQHTGWQGEKPLVDPMCGSGTLLAEALMAHCRVPAGYKRRHFGFMAMPDFDDHIWLRVKRAADAQIRPLAPGLIAGADNDAIACQAAIKNLHSLPQGANVAVAQADIFTGPGYRDSILVFNPPYGIRLKEHADLPALYARLGDFLKQKCQGSSAYILCGEIELVKSIGLHVARRIPIHNGELEARLIKLDLY
jgi:putative N6-adenine-specific DNA methylase